MLDSNFNSITIKQTYIFRQPHPQTHSFIYNFHSTVSDFHIQSKTHFQKKSVPNFPSRSRNRNQSIYIYIHPSSISMFCGVLKVATIDEWHRYLFSLSLRISEPNRQWPRLNLATGLDKYLPLYCGRTFVASSWHGFRSTEDWRRIRFRVWTVCYFPQLIMDIRELRELIKRGWEHSLNWVI